MKQIVDKLNKIAKAIDSDVTISNRKLIIDSLDSITKAFGGTPNDSNLIVDKLETIARVAHGGGGEGLTYYTCPVTHVFPEGMTINNFLELTVFNYLELDPYYRDSLSEGTMGAHVILFDTPVIFIGFENALLSSLEGSDTNYDMYDGVITGENVIYHEPEDPLGSGYYEITGNGAITITWTRRMQ